VQGISFTSDAAYLATGNIQGTSGQNDLYIYKKNEGTDTYSILYIPSNSVPIRDLKFDQTDTYLAVVHSAASPFLKIYKRVGDAFTLLSNPSYLPPNNCYSLSWGNSGTYLAVGCDSSPYIIIYKRTGDTFTVLSNPNILPSDKVSSVSFSADGIYLVVGFRANPFCIVYKRTGDTFTKLNITPTFSGDTTPFITPDSTYMLINISPYSGFDVYKRTGDNFTYITHLSGTPIKMIFTGDSKYFAVATQSYPYLFLYKINTDDTFTLLSNPNILPAGIGQSVTFSSDGSYLAVGHGNSPYFSIYKKDIGYQDAGEIDLRYTITPVSNVKEVLGYFTKSIVTNFNLEGYISFQTEGGIESYVQLSSSSVNLSVSVQEVKFSGQVVESKPIGIFKVKATKATGSLNTTITKLLGMVR
jgi:WD40 repeat protein